MKAFASNVGQRAWRDSKTWSNTHFGIVAREACGVRRIPALWSPTPSAAVSLESTPEAQTGGSAKTSTELPLKEFVFEYIRTVASNDATAQTRFFEPRVNYLW